MTVQTTQSPDQASVMQTTTLSVDQSTTVTIEARKRWNCTGIRLVAGQKYQFTAVGRWCDKDKECDADGIPNAEISILLRLLKRFIRVPRERLFALMGAIDCDEHTVFLIGKNRMLMMPVSGMLTCFANDGWIAYENNSGSVQLTVTRTP